MAATRLVSVRLVNINTEQESLKHLTAKSHADSVSGAAIV